MKPVIFMNLDWFHFYEFTDLNTQAEYNRNISIYI